MVPALALLPVSVMSEQRHSVLLRVIADGCNRLFRISEQVGNGLEWSRAVSGLFPHTLPLQAPDQHA